MWGFFCSCLIDDLQGWLILHPWRPRGRGAVQTPSPPATGWARCRTPSSTPSSPHSRADRWLRRACSPRGGGIFGAPCHASTSTRESSRPPVRIGQSPEVTLKSLRILQIMCWPIAVDRPRNWTHSDFAYVTDIILSVLQILIDGFGAASSAPREFHLHFDYRYDSYLLEMHKLGSNSGCLTKLHLTNVSLHECFMEHITTVCTLLEVLELNRCSLYLQEITHPKLKNLVLHGPAVYDEDELPVGANAKCYKELIIRAPCLTYLNLVLPVDMRQISLKEMPSLVRASIRFSVVFPCKCNFLNVLFNVTSLELSGFREMVSPLFLIHVSCKHLC